ncbi:MAG: DUF1292 domain-containing protein [Clostridia bacterium]|nr:DUF1292 domain-containing protein [Clostridia bacterium]
MEETFDGDVFTLTDETGKESEFELIGTCEFEGKTYYALIPVEDGAEEYVILRLETDDAGEEMLVTIDDDDEFDRVADYFEDELFDTVDYDAGEDAQN